MADFGTDVSTYQINEDGAPDLDPTFQVIEGERVLGEQILRAWELPPGALSWDRKIGGGLYDLISKRMTTNVVLEKQGQLTTQAEMDERVFGAEVEVTVTGDNEVSIAGDITSTEGTFRLVAAVSDVTVELLAPE